MENIVVESYKRNIDNGKKVFVFDISYEIERVTSVENMKFGGNGPNSTNVRVVQIQPDRARTTISIERDLLLKFLHSEGLL